MPSYGFDVSFDAPLAEVWRVVSDTDLLDGAIGVPAITYRDEPQPDGTSRRFGRVRKLGVMFEYEELPFTWVHEQMYEVLRVFSRGAFRTFRHTCELIPRDPNAPDTGCTVRTTFTFEPTGIMGLLAGPGVKRDLVRPYQRVFAAANQRLKAAGGGESAPGVLLDKPLAMSELDLRPAPGVPHRVQEFANRTRELLDTPLLPRLADAISSLPDEELRRMQPWTFAARWSAPRPETLNVFLAATKAGLLKMRWDVICPHCRGDKQNLASLSEVRERAFCPACNIDFDVDLDRSLEAVFTPHPQVREVPEHHYCLGGPGSTPHVVYQKLLQPGETHQARLRLPAGRYRARFSGESTFRWIEARGAEPAQLAWRVQEDHLEGADARIPAGAYFDWQVSNDSSRKVLAVLETVDWARDALSAGELVADQRFRDLFSAEVLAPGIKLAVQEATILFTDLVGSTAMYNSLGDARAFALVRTHFDVLHEIVALHGGAIVKTIGDAIMAVFTKPQNALLAAAELHQRTDAYVREHGHDTGARLKIGLHNGPCIAVTLNDRLDYFGTTVNLAARVQHLSEGGDIVVSKSLADGMGGCAALRESGWKSALEQAQAKGFDQPVPVLRWKK
ncbi:MAG: SRPBCC family protein [Planctomycetes bacterium]|nr:SRPBCC family protein [Planctomycetota bacterium]